jgi:hypothetical protein
MKFPVIVFTKKGHMLSHPNWKHLTTLSHKGWERGGYNGLKIVDSNGLCFTVREAKKVGYPGLFFGYSLLKQRGVRVDLAYDSEPRTLPLLELKQMVVASIQSARSFWVAADMKQLLRELKAATSHQRIIELILGE